ncbi:hypothetical protein HHK36_001398 [Tetracentron sinense]|uniref:NAC-A/B domain-containing protein n=1 Tax=Tetracentron sinense TaxID=13715 RepID=A0A835DRL7_TETSI|nr:hypothetical protein HHK36_001398 [Tetracentron sinense]
MMHILFLVPENLLLGEQGAGANDSAKQSRSEKKSRKAMLKLGMKPITSVSRVTIKRTKNTQAAQQFRMPDMGSIMAKPNVAAASTALQADEEEEEVDETGVEARDIDLVMTQAGVSRGKAVKALKNHNGDIVSAIMELTT